MIPFHFSLSATLSDLRAAVEQVEQALAHLAVLHQILARIRLRLDGFPDSMRVTESIPWSAALLLLNQPEFGQALRFMRETRGWTRKHLAKLSGLSPSTIRNLESRALLSLTGRVRHRIISALAGQRHIRPRCKKPRA